MQQPEVSEVGLAAWQAFWGVRREIDAAFENHLTRFAGVSMADYSILAELAQQGEMRVGDLADSISWERSRLSHHLGRMEKRGLVSRRPAQADRRGVLVQIADQGRTVLDSATPVYMDFLHHGILAGLSPDDLLGLIDLISRLEEHLTRYQHDLDSDGQQAG